MLGPEILLLGSVLSGGTLSVIADSLKKRLAGRGIGADEPLESKELDSALRTALETAKVETPAGLEGLAQLPQAQLDAVATVAVASQRLGAREADRLTTDALSDARQSLARLRDEKLRQAKFAFNVAIAIAVVGIMVILVGVVLMFVGEGVTPGGITAAVGAIAEIIGILLFRLWRHTSEDLRTTESDLRELEAMQVLISVADKMSDSAQRDALLREAAEALASTRTKPDPSDVS